MYKIFGNSKFRFKSCRLEFEFVTKKGQHKILYCLIDGLYVLKRSYKNIRLKVSRGRNYTLELIF